MKKTNELAKASIPFILSMIAFSTSVLAAPAVYTVESGDSLWEIAARYEMGLSEIEAANPQIKNFDLIHPGDEITIPEASSLKSIEEEVVRLVNVERANRGLYALAINGKLSRIARRKSRNMIDEMYFSHESPTYGSPFHMMESFGLTFTAAAENIAYGQRTPAEVVKDWMDSPGHRSNILSTNVTQIGVGAAKAANGTLYWTQMFIRPL